MNPRGALDESAGHRAPVVVHVGTAPAESPGGDRARAPAAAHHPVRAGLADGGPGPHPPGEVELLSARRPPDRGPDRRVQELHDGEPAAEREHLRHAPGPPAHLRFRQDRGAGGRGARPGAASRPGELERVRDLVVQNVRQAYFSLLQARRLVGVADAALARSELNLRSAQGFFDVGTKPKSDVTRAEVEVANARVDVIRARNLVRLLGDQPGQRARSRGDGAHRDRGHPDLRAGDAGFEAAPRGGARQPARAPAVPGPAGRGPRPAIRREGAVPPRPDGPRHRGHVQRRRRGLHRRLRLQPELCRRVVGYGAAHLEPVRGLLHAGPCEGDAGPGRDRARELRRHGASGPARGGAGVHRRRSRPRSGTAPRRRRSSRPRRTSGWPRDATTPGSGPSSS